MPDSLLTAFLLAAIISAYVTPLSIPLARKLRAVSVVRPDRWHRDGRVPRLGGIGIVAGVCPWMELEYAAVIIGFFTVGVLDDIFQIKPARKGLMLVVPCAMAGVVTGEIWLAALCWIAANAYNLLDHADGVAGASAFGSLLFVLTPLGIAAAGASAGFLVHNFPRARLFMGDGGSYALGAILVLAWYQTGPVGVLLGIAVPCADTAFVVVRRCLAGRAPWIGGVDHTGHVMLRAGVPPRLMPFIYGGAAAGFAGLGSWIY